MFEKRLYYIQTVWLDKFFWGGRGDQILHDSRKGLETAIICLHTQKLFSSSKSHDTCPLYNTWLGL